MAIDWSGYVRDYRKNGSTANNNQTNWGSYAKKKKAINTTQRFQKLGNDFYSAQDRFYNNWNNPNDSDAFLTKSKNYYQELQGFYDDLKNNADIYKGVLGDESYSKTYNSLGDILKNKDNADKYITSQSELYKKYQNADEYNKAKKQAGFNRKYSKIKTFKDYQKNANTKGEILEKLPKDEQDYLKQLGFYLEYSELYTALNGMKERKATLEKNLSTPQEYRNSSNWAQNQRDLKLLNANIKNAESRLSELNSMGGMYAGITNQILANNGEIAFDQRWAGTKKAYEDYKKEAEEKARFDKLSGKGEYYTPRPDEMTPEEKNKALSGQKVLRKREDKYALEIDPIFADSRFNGEGVSEILEYYATPEEKEIHAFLKKTEGEGVARQYLEELKTAKLDKRLNQAIFDAEYEYGSKNPLIASIASVGYNLLSGIEMLGQINNPYYQNHRSIYGTKAQGQREGVKSQIDSDGWDTVYDWVMSSADSVTASLLSGNNKLLQDFLIGSSAAASTYSDALNRGVSHADALNTSMIAGVAEGTFEHFSLGRMFDISDITKGFTKAGLKQAAKKVATDMFVNFSEESLTEISNIVADQMINGELSNYATSVRNYMSQGLTEEEAKKKAASDVAIQIGEAGLSGMLMGAGFGMVGSVRGMKHSQMLNSRSGSIIKQNGSLTELKELANNSGVAEIQKAAEKLTPTSKASKIGSVYNSLIENAVDNSVKQMTPILLKNGATKSGSNSAEGWARQIATSVLDNTSNDRHLYTNNVTKNVYTDFTENGKYGSNEIIALRDMTDTENRSNKFGPGYVTQEGNIINERGIEVPMTADGRAAVGPVSDGVIKSLPPKNIGSYDQNGEAQPSPYGRLKTLADVYGESVANKLEAERPSPKAKTEADVQAEKQAYFDKYFAKEKQITPEEEEHLKEFGESKGLEVEFVDGAVNDIGYGVFENGKKIVISRYAKKPMRILFKHEFTHSVENAKGYKSFQEYVFKESEAFKEWLATKGFEDSSAAIKDMMERYKGKVDYNKVDTDSTDKKDNNYEKAKADVIADFVGEVLFGKNIDKNENPIKIDTNFLVELKRKDRNLFWRFVEWVDSIIQRLKASGVVNKDIIRLEQKFKRLAEQARQQRTKGKQSKGEYSLPDVDNLSEEQYNDFGWVRANDVLTAAEYSTLLSRYTGHKHTNDNFPVTRFGETVVHSSDYNDVLMYVKGPIVNPQITKVVRIDDDNSYVVNKVKEELLKLERAQTILPFSFIRDVYGERILGVYRLRDYASLQELQRRRKRKDSTKDDNSNRTEQDGKGSTKQNKETSRADSIDEPAYSLPQLDAEYMRYVDSWNKESAQKMVDNAAKEAGAILDENGNPLKLYRGTMGGQTVFKKETTLNGKIYTIDNIDIATNYGDKSGKATEIAHQIEGEKTTYALYGFPKKMLTIDANYGVWSDLVVPEELLKYSDGRYKATNAEIAEWAEKEGYDALKIDNVRDGSFDAGSEIIFFNENLVKSADAITKDNNGNVISLSERFNTENADIRYSLPDDGYAPTFYSKMGKTVDEMKQDKIGANSVVSYLTGRGVKSEEIKWSGIETFLEGKKSVTKAELQEFIAGSQLQIEENVLGKDTFKEFFDAMSDATDIHITRQQFAKYIQESDGEYNKIAQLLEWTNVSEEKKQDVLSKYKKAVENFGKDVAKWEEYKLDGGENYREITFKMPNSTYTNGAMQAHWGVAAEGILAHARLQDFNVDGKKMLFVEEIQSDWHNMGHKKGYREKGRKTAREIYLESQEAYKDFYKTVSKMLDDKGISYNPVVIANLFAGENVGFNFLNGFGEVKKLTDEEIQYIKTESQKEKNRQQAMDTAPGYDSVPDAPFKDNYHEFVLKNLIRNAAENGYDFIGWTPADIQSERWSDEFAEGYRIEYDQDIPKFLKKYGKQWGATVGKTYLGDATQKKASYVISTDIGNDGQYYSTIEEAVEALIENTNENFGTDFSADSVDIDEWDGIVRVSDEETGAEIGTLHTEYGNPDSRGVTEVWSMDITDKMKNSVLYEGQALYSLPDDGYNIPEIARGKSNEELNRLIEEGKITTDDAFNSLRAEHGTMPKGESPKVDVTVPNKVSEKQGVRRFARTALESGHLTDGMSEEAKREILDGALNYKILSNNTLVRMAENEVKNDINKAIKKWEDLVESGRMPTAKEIVLGEVLMVEAAKAGNANDVAMYLAELSAMGTELGQGIQALSLLKKLSGVGQLHYVSRVIAQLNEDLKRRFGDKYLDKMVKLNPYQEKMLAESKNESEIESIIDDILTDVARQLPSTWRDKLNAWRYLAMLGNVKTHLRNFLGNGVFMPAIRLKNTLASVAEKIIIRDEANRTKSFKLKKEYKDFAEADFKNVSDLISKGGKMSPSGIVDERRKIFTSKAFAWLEKARQFNFNMLEKEDMYFLQRHYKVALASVLQSRGLDLNNITDEQLQSARNYAIKEAQKATYRDFSYFANMLNKLANPNKNGNGWDALRSVGGVLIEGAVPFKKTPINVLKRGIEYSPIGIATSLANAAMAAKRGEFSGAELIDGLSAGMSGTMILGLGMFLQAIGWITGGLGYDDDDALERMSGAQPYSLNFGEVINDLAGVVGIDADVDNYSLTIDWMAPSSLPLLIGAEIQKANEEAENYNLLDALATIGEPMTELSFLQGISDVIDGIAYSGKDSLGKIGEPLTNLVSSYLSQYIPTLSGQTARTLDESRRTNFIDKDSIVPKSIQKVWQKTLGKIPFAANEKVPYIDAWGKVDKEDNVLLRAFENFLSPTYISKIEDDKVNKELAKVYADTKDSGIIPKRASTSFEVNGEDKFLTPEEYVKYATNRGQYSRQYVETVMGNSMYQGLSSENKAEAISFLLSFADAKAKGDVSDYDYATERSFKSAAKFEMAGIDVTSYAIAKAAMRKENADTDGSGSVDKDERKEALEKAGFTRRERNKFLDIYYSNYEDILDDYGE